MNEMDSQREPLISDGGSEDRIPGAEQDNTNEDGPATAPSESPPGLFLWLLTFSAGISGLLFGYDTGVISATLVSIDTSLSNRPLTSLDKSLITAVTALFALLASPLGSVFADRFGRKPVILFADCLFIVGALVQAFSETVTSMVAGRAVVGAAVGAASFVVPLYIAEMAPAAYRGKLVTMNVVFITLGQVIAYVVGWAFAEYGTPDFSWRWMVGLGAVPAAIQNIVVFLMPETPRWLVKTGQPGRARLVIQRLLGPTRGSPRLVANLLKQIELELLEEGAEVAGSSALSGWRELMSTRRNRRATIIACLLQFQQQASGFNSLMYFSATIFRLIGLPSPTLTSLTVAGTNLVFTVAAMVLIDRVGRRRILLWTIPFMVAGLLASAVGFRFIPHLTEASSALSSAAALPTATAAAVAIVISIMVYVAAYAAGLGNVPWMQSELFALRVRSLGSGLATATNWATNFVVGLTFLPLMEAVTPSVTFLLYATLCTAGYIVIWRIYPETAGLDLREAASLLEDDSWGVRRRSS